MELMTFWSVTGAMAIHSVCNAASSWLNVWGCRTLFRTLLSSLSQIRSIGDKSGDSNGHDITFRFCARRKSILAHVECPGVVFLEDSYPWVVANEGYDTRLMNLISVVQWCHSSDLKMSSDPCVRGVSIASPHKEDTHDIFCDWILRVDTNLRLFILRVDVLVYCVCRQNQFFRHSSDLPRFWRGWDNFPFDWKKRGHFKKIGDIFTPFP